MTIHQLLENWTEVLLIEIDRKLRTMTPGAEVLIANWSLVEVDRKVGLPTS